MAHKKGQGSSRNGRDSNSQRLGVKATTVKSHALAIYGKLGASSRSEAVELAANAMRAGAAGVDMGRNIFQSDCPVGMIKAVRAVVHDGATVDGAFAVYEQEQSKGSR